MDERSDAGEGSASASTSRPRLRRRLKRVSYAEVRPDDDDDTEQSANEDEDFATVEPEQASSDESDSRSINIDDNAAGAVSDGSDAETSHSVRTETRTALKRKRPPGKKMTGADKAPQRKAKDSMTTIYDTNPAVKGVNLNLPPLSNINEIFIDLTKKAIQYGLDKVANNLGFRRLRVATMCSGTESPLLALEMIQASLTSLVSPGLDIEHVFSAEIEPYKQSYIERNFQPPIIFRDIVEITHSKDGTSTTAYGAKVQIPDNVDIVIAGTSCVDFSPLNRMRKGLNDGGESSDTFTAVLDYAKQFHPRMLILENVFGAPWDEMIQAYELAGYSAAGVLVDTKDFYLPQTRRRGYMFCVHNETLGAKKARKAVDEWVELMKAFKRQVSSPVSAFLLPNDHADVVRSRHRLSKQAALDDKIRDVDWSKSEIRHIKYRQLKGIGSSRPYTSWESSGMLDLYDYADTAWHRRQVERVWDFEDCSVLRKAHPEGGHFDIQFKTRVWDVSQNIDRYTDTAPFGVSSCLTPSGNFFVTDRGGPTIFVEVLALQGIPLDKNLITTETERQVQNLAGNAMSTPVVGSAIAAALIATQEMLHQAVANRPAAEPQMMKPVRILGLNELEHKIVHPNNSDIDIQAMIRDACSSSSKCYCEGQLDTAESQIQVCRQCSHTTCVRCGGKPVHDYVALDLGSRCHPDEFKRKWRSTIPTRLSLRLDDPSSIADLIRTHMHGREAGVPSDTYISTIQGAIGEEFTFSDMRRSTHWSIRYEAPSARLDLVITAESTEWQLYAKPDASLSGNDSLRIFLEQPVGRSSISSGQFLGQSWEWRIPENISFDLKISGTSLQATDEEVGGGKVPSWGAKLNIPALGDETLWPRLTIDLVAHHKPDLRYDVSGTYEYLPGCGTAYEALYGRIDDETDAVSKRMFLFFDPTRIEEPAEDQFVFSTSPRRLQYDENREIIASLQKEWRPWELGKVFSSPKGAINGRWIHDGASPLTPVNKKLDVGLATGSRLSLAHKDCTHAVALACVTFPVQNENVKPLLGSQIKPDNRTFFSTFAWALERLRTQVSVARERAIPTSNERACNICAPMLPDIRWTLHRVAESLVELRPYEDPKTAIQYEIALKSRPDIFVVNSSIEGDKGCIEIGLNALSLTHRAVSKLRRLASNSDITSTWSLDTEFFSASARIIPPFVLRGNDADVLYDPELPKINLWKKQQQSLAWMKRQEAGEGGHFELEAAEEALLPHLGWRAESRAAAIIRVRGGILADHPGFGKTITSLCLIETEFRDYNGQHDALIKNMKDLSQRPDGLPPIKIAATLIICPKTLIDQWSDEIVKVLGSKYNKDTVLKIKDVSNVNKCRLRMFREARIILLDPSILGKSTYLARMARFAGVPEPGTKRSREFKVWLDIAIRAVHNNANILQREGSTAVREEIQRTYQQHLNHTTMRSFARKLRFKGKKYQEAKKKAEKIRLLEENKMEKDAALLSTFNKTPDKKWLSECVLFEMFHFNRIIVDEFAYTLSNKQGILTSISALTADKRWGLSATPPLHDPYDVSQIARMLGINLPNGANLPGNLSTKNMEAIRDDMTNIELFETFLDAPSHLLQARVHDLAQKFLDTFVRQNILQLDERPYRDTIVPVTLDLGHRIVYTELSQRLNSQDMKIKKKSKKKAEEEKSVDQEYRISNAVNDAENAEEALSSVATFFSPTEASGGFSGLDALLQKRKQELTTLGRDLRDDIMQSQKMSAALNHEERPYDLWKESVVAGQALGDRGVTTKLKVMISEAEKLWPDSKAISKPHKKTPKKKEEEDLEDGETAKQESKVESDTPLGQLRTQSSKTNQTAKRFTAMARTIRFVKNAMKIQEQKICGDNGVEACDFGGCISSPNFAELAVSSVCGHTICVTCLDVCKRGLRICGAEGCANMIRDFDLLWANKMAENMKEDLIQDGQGKKLQALIDLLKDIDERGDQAVLFVQHEKHIASMAAILIKNSIKCAAINQDKSARIQDFQKNVNKKTRKTLIILNADDESAAGTNLTNANHVIFLSPLLKDTQYEYDAQMAQAIGRIRRPGQTKTMTVYRMVALDTIDVDILEHREHNIRPVVELKHASEDEDAPMYSRDPFAAHETAPSREKTQLIRDVDGLIKLVPKSLLLRAPESVGTISVEGRNRVKGFEDFSSLIKWSKAYSDE